MIFKNYWSGKDVYIVGGGPSLKDFDWALLKGKNIIAINKALFALPNAQVIYFSDCKFWDQEKKAIAAHKAKFKITPCMRATAKDDNLTYIRPTGIRGLEVGEGIREGRNSGYAALNLAYHLGARKVFLLGYDFATEGELTHWHEGYSDGPSIDVSIDKLNRYMKQFQYISGPLKEAGVQVINTNMSSFLGEFPKKDVFNSRSKSKSEETDS